VTGHCKHPLTDICRDCILTYIHVELGSRGMPALRCPICPAQLAYDDVRRLAAPADFAVYDERIAVEALERDPLFRWCPHGGCGVGQLAALGDAEPRMTCVSCGRMFCFTHRARWHRGMTCSEVDAAADAAADEQDDERTDDERPAPEATGKRTMATRPLTDPEAIQWSSGCGISERRETSPAAPTIALESNLARIVLTGRKPP
jgi:hypothetical protein